MLLFVKISVVKFVCHNSATGTKEEVIRSFQNWDREREMRLTTLLFFLSFPNLFATASREERTKLRLWRRRKRNDKIGGGFVAGMPYPQLRQTEEQAGSKWNPD